MGVAGRVLLVRKEKAPFFAVESVIANPKWPDAGERLKSRDGDKWETRPADVGALGASGRHGRRQNRFAVLRSLGKSSQQTAAVPHFLDAHLDQV